MGRRKLDTAALRSCSLNPRLTEAERLTIEANAAFYGLSPSEFMRRAALEKRMPAAKTDQKAAAVRSTALIRIGNNLNQLTHHANAGKGLLESELLSTLSRINAELDRLYDPAPG